MSKPTSTRRWPDILIGVLVLLLLAGFAALLLGQRRTAATTTPTATASATSGIPAAPTTEITGITPPVADTPPAADTGSAATAPADAAPSDAAPTDTAPTDTAPAGTAQTTPSADASTEAPIIPAAPTDAAATTPQTTPDAAASTGTQPAENPTAETPTTETPTAKTPAPQTETPQAQITETPTTPPAETPATTVAPRSGGAVTTSESRTPLRSDYRISLGTFGSVGTAQSRTAPVSTLGYTVYPIDLGSQVVAQVGPFADEASARQALGDIQRAYPGALLYPPRARAGSTTSTSDNSSDNSANSNTASSSAPASAPTPDRTPATAPTPDAPNSPIYLQVGAFDRVESAQKMVQQLRDLGYVPTVNAPDGRKVTVAVGPYTGDALTRTEQRLDDNNLDHFRVR